MTIAVFRSSVTEHIILLHCFALNGKGPKGRGGGEIGLGRRIEEGLEQKKKDAERRSTDQEECGWKK